MPPRFHDLGPAGPLKPQTLLVAGARPEWSQGAPVNAPLVLSSTYVSVGTPAPGVPLYARQDTEAWHGPEALTGELEGAPGPAVLFGSGMAAIAAVLALVPLGGRVIVPPHAYQVTVGLAEHLAERGELTVAWADIADTAAVTAALDAAPTALVWAESPTNPLLEVADLPALARAAHARGALLAVDNTFATPLVQQPLALGADLAVHSVTKYLAGHSDVVLGAVAAADPALDARLREHRTLAGAIPGPFEAWLALRGMRTLALRVARSGNTATDLAARLNADPRCGIVRHPSLPGTPGHLRAKAQMSGFGSIIAFEPIGGMAAAEAVTRATRLWVPATSLGGVESSLERRRRYPGVSEDVPEGLIRLSVGIEDAGDLWADLDQALALGARAAE